jgi:O-antigen/teichoic acid export membrane protein
MLGRPSAGASANSRLVHGVSWQVITSVISRLLTFSIAIIQARLLGKAGYGQLGMVLSTLTLFGLFSSASAGATCTKFIAELRSLDKPRAERICGLSLLVMAVFAVASGAVCLIGAPYVAAGALKAPQLASLIRLSAAALIAQSVGGTFSGVLLGLQAFRAESLARTVQIVIWLPFTVILTSRFGLIGAMYAYVLSFAIGAVILGAVMMRECAIDSFRPAWRGTWREVRVLWEYSVPMMLHGFLCVPAVWVTNAMLARQPHGYAALGGYNAAFQFRTAILQLPMILQSVAAPVLSELAGKRDSRGFLRLFDRLYRLNSAIGLALGLTLTLFGGYLLTAFGKDFRTDHVVFGFVMAIAATSLLSSFSGVALQMLGGTWPALYANIAYAVVSIVLAAALVPSLGALGLAGAFIVSTAIQCTTILYLLNRTLPHLDIRLYLFLAIGSAILIPAISIVPPVAKVLAGVAVLAICWFVCCRPIAAGLRMRLGAFLAAEGEPARPATVCT